MRADVKPTRPMGAQAGRHRRAHGPVRDRRIVADYPLWVQLRNRFVYLIKTGYYQPGDQLPSVRTLAAEAAINYNTVSKVYVNLEQRRLRRVRARPRRVRARHRRLEGRRRAVPSPTPRSRAAIRRCLALGMTIDEVTLQHDGRGPSRLEGRSGQVLSLETRRV